MPNYDGIGCEKCGGCFCRCEPESESPDAAVVVAIRERQELRRKWTPNAKEQEIVDIDHLLSTCDSLRAEVERLEKTRQEESLARHGWLMDVARRSAISECVEKVKEVSHKWAKVVEQDSAWTPWVNAANKLRAELEALQAAG